MSIEWLAQAADAAGPNTDLVGILIQLGLSGVFLWQWRSERDQRVKREDQLLEMAQTTLPIVTEASSALKSVSETVGPAVAKAAALPDRADLDLLMRRVELAVDSLSKTVADMQHLRKVVNHEPE